TGFTQLAVSVLATAVCGSPDSTTPGPVIKLTGQYAMRGIPERGGAFDYEAVECLFRSGRGFECVHPLQSGGELCTWNPQSGTVTRVPIPQPSGFKPPTDVRAYFDNARLTLNRRGDRFIQWDLRWNGDHGLARLPNGSTGFATARTELVLGNSRVVSAPDGS